jgi:hypothetical protein
MAKRLSPQRAELFRLREYGKRVRTLKRGAARAAKVWGNVVFTKRAGGK